MVGQAESGHPFVGRADAVETLHRHLEDVQAGRGGVALLIGETGVGKSTLVDDLVRDIRARGVRLLIGRALALDDPPPFSLIQSAFESMRDDPILRSEDVPSLGGDQVATDLAPLLAEAAFPFRGGMEQRLLEALDKTEARRSKTRNRVLIGISDTFRELTQKGPTVLILDELHRADASSLAAIEFLAHQLQDRPLWVLATSRPPFSLSESGRAQLRRFESATRAEQIILRPLTLGEVATYLRVNEPSRKFSSEEIARRHTETGGNPLLLEQLNRRTSSGSKVRAHPGPGFPPLDEDAQRVLDVAAVLGPEFNFQLLRGATGEDEDRLARIVNRLVDQGFLFERTDQLLEFPQDRLREETYGHLPESRRRLLHQRAGETREALESAGSDRVFSLARDFYLGKVNKKAIEYNRVAAEIAEGASAPDVARDFLLRALESQRDLDPGDQNGEAELLLELVAVNYELGRLEEAEGILRAFLRNRAEDPRFPPSLRATFELYLARVLSARGDLGTAKELAEKILNSPNLHGQAAVLMGAHSHLGVALYYDGRYSEAFAHHTEVMRLAREGGNEKAYAHALLWHSGCLAMMGQPEQALIEAREVAASLDRLGSVGESAQGHLFLGNMLADNRSTAQIRQEAIAELGKTIRLAAKAQDPRRVGWAFYHTAELLREEGRLKDALVNAQQACDTLARIGDRVGHAVSLKVRGQVAMDEGSYDRAETDLVEAHRILEGLNNRLNEIDIVLRLAQLCLLRGDRVGASRHVAELERLKLPEVRSDLSPQFTQLKSRLAAT
jgi:predicted ATPase